MLYQKKYVSGYDFLELKYTISSIYVKQAFIRNPNKAVLGTSNVIIFHT